MINSLNFGLTHQKLNQQKQWIYILDAIWMKYVICMGWVVVSTDKEFVNKSNTSLAVLGALSANPK